MGAFLDKPKVDKQNESGKCNDINYAISSMQGWRVDMEDNHTAVLSIPDLPKWSFFAVFDGHAGSKVAEQSSQQLLKVILKQDYFKQLISGGAPEDDALIAQAVQSAFFELDANLRQLVDSEDGIDRSGSTCVCVLISPSKFYFINCGDSRALLCSKAEVKFATADHKPCNPIERERIQKAGGSVMLQRVNGSLAVSRALGDYEYKSVEDLGPTEQLVSPEPDVTPIERKEGEDQFLVLACDGIFDVSSDEDLCSFISYRLNLTEDLVSVCNDVVDLSLHKGSRDNMTFVLLGLPAIPKPTAEALNTETVLEDHLRTLIKEIVDEEIARGCAVEFIDVFETLATRSATIPGLPPGGGVYAKRLFVESIFKELCPYKSISVTEQSDSESNATEGNMGL